MSDLKMTLFRFRLRFKHPFKIAHGTRDGTDVVFVKLGCKNYTGWGEAALPPYLVESQESVINFLSAIDLSAIRFPLKPADEFNKIDAMYTENMAAKAAFDMALWNLKSQLESKAIGEMLGVKNTGFPLATYTIGVCGFGEMGMRIKEADDYGFEIFKLKLNGEKDDEVINNFRNLSPKAFAVDVNQGWKSVEEAMDKLFWLKELGCLMVEQPLPVALDFHMPILLERCGIPLFADESCKTLGDVENMPRLFNGVNIKLMKCGGISKAFEMLQRARELGLNVLIGCMSESSVGCTAAAQLAPLADYADLDGPYLIANDPFSGVMVEQGRTKLNPLVSKNVFRELKKVKHK